MKITTNNSDKKNSLTNISRDRYTSIKKKRITSFIDYNSLDLNLISKLLNQVIQNYTYSTFDLIKLIKENFNGWFCVNLTQAGVITERGASVEEMPP